MELILWYDRYILICVVIIKFGVIMVCINKRSFDCVIFDVYIVMILMFCVYLFLLFDFLVCFYYKFIIYVCRFCELKFVYYCINVENFRLLFFNGV